MKRFGMMPPEKEILLKMKFQIESEGVYLWCGSYKIDDKTITCKDALVCTNTENKNEFVWAFYDEYIIYNLMHQMYILSPVVSLMRLLEKVNIKNN